MTPTMTKKGSRLYRYYVSMDLIRNRDSDAAMGPQRLPAGVVEGAVIQEIRKLVRTPEIVARTISTVRQQAPELSERDVIAALNDFDALWGSLFPAEQARIVHLLVQRVSVSADGIAVDLRTEGLGSVVREMIRPRTEDAIA
jgi:site-specific DNA recombinase